MLRWQLTIIGRRIRGFINDIMNYLDDYINAPHKLRYLRDMCESYDDEVSILEECKSLAIEKHADLETELNGAYSTLHHCQDEVKILSRQCVELRNVNTRLSKSVAQAEAFSLKNMYSLTVIKQKWLKAMIEDINNECYAGCGLYYELYEERRQNALANFLERNKHALTDEEIKQFKIDAEYIEDFEPYSEYDEELGRQVSIHEMIQQEMV